MEAFRHEKIAVAVDFLIMTIEDDKLKVLMVRRNEEPFKGVSFRTV